MTTEKVDKKSAPCHLAKHGFDMLRIIFQTENSTRKRCQGVYMVVQYVPRPFMSTRPEILRVVFEAIKNLESGRITKSFSKSSFQLHTTN